MASKLEEIDKNGQHRDTIDLIIESRDKITNIKATEWKDLYDEAIELLDKASNNYSENRLTNDLASQLISKLNKDYPKNKTAQNDNNNEDKYIDLNGDGVQEVLQLTVKNPDDENIGKYKAAKKHFEIINDYIKTNNIEDREIKHYKYKFTMLTPINFETYFNKLKNGKVSEIDNFKSELDITLFPQS
jgi:type III restriction enzyme